jgi:hypothetical protein
MHIPWQHPMQAHHMQLLLQQQQQGEETLHQQAQHQQQGQQSMRADSAQQTASVLQELQGIPVSSNALSSVGNSLLMAPGPQQLQGTLPPNHPWLQHAALGLSYNPTLQQQQQLRVMSPTGPPLRPQLSPSQATLLAAQASASAAAAAGSAATPQMLMHTHPTDTNSTLEHQQQQQQQQPALYRTSSTLEHQQQQVLYRSGSTADPQQQQQQGVGQRRRGRRVGGGVSGGGAGVSCSHLEVNGGMDLAASSRLLRTSSGKVLR